MENKYKFILVLPDGEKFVLKRTSTIFGYRINSDPEQVIKETMEFLANASHVTFEIVPAVGVIKREWVVLWGDKLKNSHLEVREMG